MCEYFTFLLSSRTPVSISRTIIGVDRSISLIDHLVLINIVLNGAALSLSLSVVVFVQ